MTGHGIGDDYTLGLLHWAQTLCGRLLRLPLIFCVQPVARPQSSLIKYRTTPLTAGNVDLEYPAFVRLPVRLDPRSLSL